MRPSSIVLRCRLLSESPRFQWSVIGLIVSNAVILGLETYDRFAGSDLLAALDRVILWLFVAELAVRLVACGGRPDRFFRSGWNVFDFVVVGASFLPWLAGNATLLRLIRLARVARLLSAMRDLRVILAAMIRSVAPLGSLLVMTGLVMFIYGMVGWTLFGDADPERWGDIGAAMLTLFGVLTLEGWIELMREGAVISPWAEVFYVSFVLVGTFVVLNMVIGVVVGSVEEARAEEREARLALEREAARQEGHPALPERIAELRAALDALERELEAPRPEVDAAPRPPR